LNIATQLIDAEVIVRRIERDPDAAMEIYQELCVTCLERPDIDWSKSQVGRIIRIIQGLKVTRFRRTSLRRSRPIDRVAPEEFAEFDPMSELNTETREHLFVELERLPRDHRAAIEQKYLREEPDDPLALKMNVNVVTIRKWRSRGIQQLRQILCDRENEI
jgi:DNA-directed RNA polymerase specialized sigma24 family protein